MGNEVRLKIRDISVLTGKSLKEIRSWDWLTLDEKTKDIDGNKFFREYVKNTRLGANTVDSTAVGDELDQMDLESLNALDLRHRAIQSKVKLEQLNERYRDRQWCKTALGEVRVYLEDVADVIRGRLADELPEVRKDILVMPTATKIVRDELMRHAAIGGEEDKDDV